MVVKPESFKEYIQPLVLFLVLSINMNQIKQILA